MHAILENAKKYNVEKRKIDHPGYSYDKKNGYWISNRTGEPLVTGADMIYMATKKEDVETGEDQKGE